MTHFEAIVSVGQAVLVLATAPPVVQQATQPQAHTDWRTWVGAAVLALLATAQMWAKALKDRWDAKHKRAEEIEDKQQERVDEVTDARIADLKEQLKAIQKERDKWRDIALEAFAGRRDNDLRQRIVSLDETSEGGDE